MRRKEQNLPRLRWLRPRTRTPPPGGPAVPAPGGNSISSARLGKDGLGGDASCDAVKKNLAALTSKGQKSIVCEAWVKNGLSAKGKAARDASRTAAKSGASTQSYEPPPDWCNSGWQWSRTQECLDQEVGLDVINSQGVRTGWLEFWRTFFVYANGNQTNWSYQVDLGLIGAYATGYGTQVTGVAYCAAPNPGMPVSPCTGIGANTFGPSAPLNPNFPARGESSFAANSIASGAFGFTKNVWNLTLTNPAWDNQLYTSATPPGPLRCDNALPGRSAGCVFGGFTPAIIYPVNGLRPEFAAHVKAAQVSGLAGAYPNGARLHG
ncbi:hypothetical protein GCM10009836_20450 [Pseudonocardia ailaonensis]|uniref:Uncharacterized protein n=1 Tax=Pseudonocardia ailaonensis TaxID=367279 RepID=A0ABN2MY71_9PSEU